MARPAKLQVATGAAEEAKPVAKGAAPYKSWNGIESRLLHFGEAEQSAELSEEPLDAAVAVDSEAIGGDPRVEDFLFYGTLIERGEDKSNRKLRPSPRPTNSGLSLRGTRGMR